MFNPEKNLSAEQESGEEVEKLEVALARTAEGLRVRGILVGDDGRLLSGDYEGAEGFSIQEIIEDNEEVARLEDIFAQDRLKDGGLEKGIPLGEQMEMFCAVMLNKFFKEEDDNLVVVRASRFDDIKNRIDYVIFDSQTGDIVGAFDAVVAGEESRRLDQKEEQAIWENFRNNGGKIKYGLNVDEDGKIIGQSREEVPVFYFNLDNRDLKDYLRKANYSAPNMGKEENKIFDEFLKSVIEQIKNYRELKADWTKESEKMFAKFESIHNNRWLNQGQSLKQTEKTKTPYQDKDGNWRF